MNEMQKSVKHWYLPMIIGILFIGLGIYSFCQPAEAYTSLAIFFGISFVVSGVVESIFTIINRKNIKNWILVLIFAIINIIFGVFCLNHIVFTMLALPIYVGIIVLVKAIIAIVFAFEMKSEKLPMWGFVLTFGILTGIFAFFMMANPAFGGMNIVFWTALAFVAVGIMNIMSSIEMKRIKNALK